MDDSAELKGGHAPAAVVGGRRIVNKKDRKYSDSVDNASSETSDDVVVREIMDADLPAKMERSYPTAAVRKFHDKPVPCHQFFNMSKSEKHTGFPHQPRKQTH